mmetsp:Transcript_18631/g.52631  ORF Transcript_18631/g.52631 Transcript_18631/m.52631 type:complete len:392 (-) Transcript_18631:94-1269(-)
MHDFYIPLSTYVFSFLTLIPLGLASRPLARGLSSSELQLLSEAGLSDNEETASHLFGLDLSGSDLDTSRKNINICCLEKHEKQDADNKTRVSYSVQAYDHKVGPSQGLTNNCVLTALADWNLLTHKQQRKECKRRFWSMKQYHELTAGAEPNEWEALNAAKAAAGQARQGAYKNNSERLNRTVGLADDALQAAKEAHDEDLAKTLEEQQADRKRLEELKKEIRALEKNILTYEEQIVQYEKKLNESKRAFYQKKQAALDEYTNGESVAEAQLDSMMSGFAKSAKALEKKERDRQAHAANMTEAPVPQRCQGGDPQLGCCCSVVVGPSYATAVLVDKNFVDWSRCINARKYTRNTAKYPETCKPWGKCDECRDLVCGSHKCPAEEEEEDDEE